MQQRNCRKAPHLVNDAMRIVGLALANNMESCVFHAARAIESSSGCWGLRWEMPLLDKEIESAEWKSSLLITTLQTISMAIHVSTDNDPLPIEYRENVVKLFSLAGHVDKLGELFRVYESNSDNGKWQTNIRNCVGRAPIYACSGSIIS